MRASPAESEDKKDQTDQESTDQLFNTVPLPDSELARYLEKHGVRYSVKAGNNWAVAFILNCVLPIGLMIVLWGFISRRMGGARSALSLGANKVHIHPEGGCGVTFDDVAGTYEAKLELREIIDFLKHPEDIRRLGGRMPKGTLLVGPPGTGKTLLARAVAGEAGVPFFNISGSDFVEMFVGVGAARVRDLFRQAREKAPCIIFIDELDAIGRSRSAGPAMGGHDEREQTLNQLLVEIDGFDPSAGVVVMAATNRPEILDKALLRSGRFDRQIAIDRPDLQEREEILEVHTRSLTTANDVDLKIVAQRTPGLVGADLANVANEAAIQAVRNDHSAVKMSDFEAAIDRVIAGPEKRHRAMSRDEIRRVAVHESGHALVATFMPTAEPVHKISIIPRGVAALGYTLQLPVEEKFLSTDEELKDQLAILMGGRVAEQLVFQTISTGAHNDLERATDVARSMVCQLGMSEHLGPLTYGKLQESPFLGTATVTEKNYAEATAEAIDNDVRALITEAYERARVVIETHRHLLDRLAERLQQDETMSADALREVIGSDAAA